MTILGGRPLARTSGRRATITKHLAPEEVPVTDSQTEPHTREDTSRSASSPAGSSIAARAERAALIAQTHPSWLSRLLRPAASTLITSADAVALAALPLLVAEHRTGLAVFAVVSFALFRMLGLQRARLSLSVLDDLPTLAVALLAATGLTAVLQATASDSHLGTLLPWLVTASLVVVVVRALSYAVVRTARSRGLVSHPTVVIGCGVIGAQLSRALLDNPRYGLRPVGFLDDEPLLSAAERPVPLLSGTECLAEVIVENDIHDVIVAFSSRNELEMIEILRTCDRLGVEIFTVPRLFEVSSARSSETVRGMPLVRLRRPTFRSPSWRFKRVVDAVVSALALLLLLPVLAACALAVRIEGGPGIIFRQKRVGIDGTTFDLLKFRSLQPASDRESATNWNIANDDRMGPVGRTIRKLSLDELPQLWNILKGDMSLVGPRPERPHFVNQFSVEHREYLHRHRVPCGLTGWAQVNGLRGDTSIGERARFDNYYIENWSLWLDVKIVLRTFAQVLRMAGG